MFDNLWTNAEKLKAVRLFADVYGHLQTAGTFPVIAFGTLLGCVRNGRQIPWDGDFDLVLDVGHKSREPQFAALQRLGYAIVHGGSHCYRVFRPDGKPIDQNFRWPWVDIYFYEVKDGEVRYLDMNGKGVYYRCSTVDHFPLKPLVFEGVGVHGPGNPELMLDAFYKGWRTTYESPKFLHKQGRAAGKTVRREIQA